MNNNTCQHGIAWRSHCPACELAEAREVARKDGPRVDWARKVIAASELPDSEGGEL